MINIPDSLYRKIITRQCILFIGAGGTKDSGGMLGSELSRYIMNNIIEDDTDYDDDLPYYTECLVSKGYRKAIEDGIRERFRILKPSTKFKKLAHIPWKCIYTTNYDDLIEMAFEEQREYGYIIEDVLDPKNIHGDLETPIVKLHGSIRSAFDPNNPLIITFKDLKENKKKKQIMIQRLTNALYDTFIFIGYSFNDGIISDILDEFMLSPKWDSIKEKYIVNQTFSTKDAMKFKTYNIQVIESSADDFFDSLYERYQNDYMAKIARIKHDLSNQRFFQGLSSKTVCDLTARFKFFSKAGETPFDPRLYYKGGYIDWEIIYNNLDVNRALRVIETKKGSLDSMNSHDLYQYFISECIDQKKQGVSVYIIKGAAVTGKTTTIYRVAYDLINSGYLSLIFKSQSEYRKGLLFDICSKVKSRVFIFIDTLVTDQAELYKMVNEARRDNLKVTFIIGTRFSEWSNSISNFNKSVLAPLDGVFELDDTMSENECEVLINKLTEHEVIKINSDFEKRGLIKKLRLTTNMINILIEIIDNNKVAESIGYEYDALSPEAQLAYGLVSTTYKYNLSIKWEMLKRAIEGRFDFSWDDFVTKILKADCKNTLFEEQMGDAFFIRGRHRYVCSIVEDLHYKGSITNQLNDLISLINCVNAIEAEERFACTLLHNVLEDETLHFSDDQKLRLLDVAINKFKFDQNIAFVMHLKGELHLNLGKYESAIDCFQSNLNNSLNEMHSLHSLGKSYYFLAQKVKPGTAISRNYYNKAIEKLREGTLKFRDNQYFFTTLFQVFDSLKLNDIFSEKDLITCESIVTNGKKFLDKSDLDTITIKYFKLYPHS